MLGQRSVIFASIGSLLPFDRLVRAVDRWAGLNPNVPVFVQIGRGAFTPSNCPWARIMPMEEYRQQLRQCSLFVAHAGMGSILQAMEEGKQILILPRDADLGEHTTHHQLHTARRFQCVSGVSVADDVDNLATKMTELVRRPLASEAISRMASSDLLEKLSLFIAKN